VRDLVAVVPAAVARIERQRNPDAFPLFGITLRNFAFVGCDERSMTKVFQERVSTKV
jgi:hypothetical protein